MRLLPLPQTPVQFSPAVHTAYNQLVHVFHTASGYIEAGSLEVHRLRQYQRDIMETAHSTLTLLQETSEQEHVSLQWIDKIADQFASLLTLVNEKYVSAAEDE